MEINREDRDIIRVEIETGHISFDKDGNMGYDGNSVIGWYGLTNGGVRGSMNG